MPQDVQSNLSEFKVKSIDVESEELHNFQVPTFVNFANIWRYGQDVYIDMALVTVEQLNTLKPGGEVTIAVYDRFVMSPAIFDDFSKRVNLVSEQLKAEGWVRDATIDTSKK
jgi:hypothetical protein